MKTKTIPAAKFKNSCLKLLNEVHKHGIPITVTRRGKPLVRVIPIRTEKASQKLLGTVVHEAKDIFSTGEDWEVDA